MKIVARKGMSYLIDADEGLMRQMLAELDPEEMDPSDWNRAMKRVRDALRARLGETAKEASDGEAKA